MRATGRTVRKKPPPKQVETKVVPVSGRILRFDKARTLFDIIDFLPEVSRESERIPVSDYQFMEEVNGELDSLKSMKIFLIGDRLSNPLVDSMVFERLLPLSVEHSKSKFFRNRVLPKNDKLLRDQRIVSDAQKRLFQLSLGSKFDKRVLKPESSMESEVEMSAELKSILVLEKDGVKSKNRVHFVPGLGEVVPNGAQVIDLKECEEVKKSRRKIHEKPEIMDYENAVIHEMRMKYLEEKRAYRKSKRQKQKTDVIRAKTT